MSETTEGEAMLGSPEPDDNDLTAMDVNAVPSAAEPDDLDGTAEAVDLPAEEDE